MIMSSIYCDNFFFMYKYIQRKKNYISMTFVISETELLFAEVQLFFPVLLTLSLIVSCAHDLKFSLQVPLDITPWPCWTLPYWRGNPTVKYKGEGIFIIICFRVILYPKIPVCQFSRVYDKLPLQALTNTTIAILIYKTQISQGANFDVIILIKKI